MKVDDAVWNAVYYSTKLYVPFNKGELVPLLAVESGSRAWGFSSEDSDYDVRFVYRHQSNWYLRSALNRQPDTISFTLEHGGLDVDVVGWDLAKFLQLLKKSNAQPVEWLYTCPIYLPLYNNPLGWYKNARRVLSEFVSPAQMAYHYRGMATKHWHRYLENKEEVTQKKYLYLMRALIYMNWYIEHGEGEHGHKHVAPGYMIAAMRDLNSHALPVNVEDEVEFLVDAKRKGSELGLGEPIPVFDEYINGMIDRYKNGLGIGISGTPGWKALEDFFLWSLGEY